MKFKLISLGIILFLGLTRLSGEEVTGPVEIYGTIYKNVDPGPPFQEAPRQLEEWQIPAPTRDEESAGFIPFTRPEPFDIKPWSRPTSEERLKSLKASVAKGEISSLWFAIYALEPLSSISIEVKPTVKGVSPTVEVRYVHFWAQRTDWRGRTYYITPELLLPMSNGFVLLPAEGGTLKRSPLDIPQGESRIFWLTIRAPENCPARDYKFMLGIRAKGKQVFELPLTVKVYPFKLSKPEDKRWLLYPDVWLWGQASEGKVLTILRDIKEHGIDGFTELPFGKLDLSRLKEGIVQYDPSPLLKFNELMLKVGLKGPHTIGAWVEGECAQVLGLQVDLNKEWPEELKEAVKKVAKCVVDTLKPHKIDWLFYGWDEPGPDNLAALQQYRCWHEAGAKTYVTFYERATYEVAGQWMTAPCFSVGLIHNPETAKWVRHQCDVRRQKFFWYGSGCYLGQEGRIFPNRYLTGWLFWKTKADAQVSWTFVRPHEDPFNDFDGMKANNVEPKDQCIVYPWFARPNDSASLIGLIPTIQWEAIREGVNDYCYAWTLKQMVEKVRQLASKKKGPEAKQLKALADKGEDTLKMIEESVPWGNEVGARKYSNKNLEEVRDLLGKEIERLALALQGKDVAHTTSSKNIVLNIRLLPPEMTDISREVPLPVLSIPFLKTKPIIDGKISSEEWKGAGVAGVFYNSQTGKPMPPSIATTAMMGYDETALYLAFICKEPHTQMIKAEKWPRDADGVWQSEGIEVFLASADEPNRYAHIIVNALGSIFDEIVFDTKWNPDIKVATNIEQGRWLCEIEISWSALPFGKTPNLRLNLCRNHNLIGEGVDYWSWSPTFGWFHNPSRFGIGKLTTAKIVLTGIFPPMLYGEDSVKLKLYNGSDRDEEVSVDSLRLRLAPFEEKEAMVKVPAEVGNHSYRLNLKGESGSEEWVFSYTIPQPLKIFSPVVLVNEKGEATLSIALSVSDEIKKRDKLCIRIDKKEYRLPIDGSAQSLRLKIALPAELLLYLASEPKYTQKARLLGG
ncbi:hypothetical protein H5T87_03300 [bacterium]|nr:hypothetical protein [bacterium]